MLLVLGFVLLALGVLSRLCGLAVYSRLTQTPARPVTPSAIPGAPWFSLVSDRVALNVIVAATYASLAFGVALTLIGALL